MRAAPGTRLGSYEILAALGAGGMGEVWRALDTRLKREVALKCLPERLAENPQALERFRREAQLLAALNHPHIAAVYGFEDGALAMELVAGDTLADRLRRGPLPVEEAVTIARQIAGALEYAHERGIIHRDLKPANIKLTPEDQVKVLDFGLAKALAPELSEAELGDSPTISAAATLAGTILGTAAYMAPEQARGKAVDRRADIFAFGAVLFEMLTGQRAFQGDDTTDVLASVLRAEPDLSQLPPATPAALRTLLVRCLRKDVRQRQQSIGDARLALEDIAAAPADAEAPDATVAVTPAVRRRWAGWLAVAAVAGLIAGAAAVWLALGRRPGAGPVEYQTIANLAGVQMQPALSPDGRSVAYVSNHDGGFNLYMALIGGGGAVQLTHGTAITAHPAWSPNGAQLAYAQLRDDGLWDVYEVAALGGTPRLLLHDAADPAWSPDGQWLAYYKSSTGTLWISHPSGEDARQLAKNFSNHDGDPRFSPDGREIAFVGQAPGPYGVLYVVNLATGAVRALTPPLGSLQSPAWAPDGGTIYFACSRIGTINIWKIPARGGTMTQVTTGQGDDANLDLSSDGTRLVFATFRTDLRLGRIQLTGGAASPVQVISADPARNQVGPAYSTDGHRVAYFTNLKGSESEQIWTSNADGSGAAPLVADGYSNIFPRWSPDGRQVLFVRESAGGNAVASVAVGGGVPAVIVEVRHDLGFDVAPGGELLYEGPNGQALAYDPARHQQRVAATVPSGFRVGTLRWAPDGRAVLFGALPQREDDPQAGIWRLDPGAAPRQIFHGWVFDFERGPAGRLYVAVGSASLNAAVWTVGPEGQNPARLAATLPLAYDYWGPPTQPFHISVAADGRTLLFPYEDQREATIGMLTLRR